MTGLTEEEALSYLKDAFSKHPLTEVEVKAAHRQLDAYTASLARRIESSPSPESESVSQLPISGVRKRYIEAVRNNAVAKRQLEAAVASIRERQPAKYTSQKDSTESGLSSHLELLHQRRRHERLNTVENFLTDLDGLSHDLQSHELERERRENPVTATTAESVGPDHENTAIDNLIAKLEVAVIQSDAEAKQEQAWLLSAQDEADSRHDVDPTRQLQALTAVRDELTQWLEQSLAKCAAPEDSDEEPQEAASETQDAADLVSAEYERYLKARQRLLSATESLKSPTRSPGHEIPPLEVHQPVSSAALLTDQVLAIEASMPQRQLEDSMRHLETYANDELDKESKDSLEALLRLVDESQLLPEYPMLVKDKRFNKVIGGLGAQSQQPSDDKVTEQVEAWAFAAEAADKSLDAAVTNHVKKATKALDEVDEMLRDLRFLHDEGD